jgi:hypothetical protein
MSYLAWCLNKMAGLGIKIGAERGAVQLPQRVSSRANEAAENARGDLIRDLDADSPCCCWPLRARMCFSDR